MFKYQGTVLLENDPVAGLVVFLVALKTLVDTGLEGFFIIPPNDCFAWSVIFFIIDVRPTLSAPFLTPAKNVCHPSPIIAKITTAITIHVITPIELPSTKASLVNEHLPILTVMETLTSLIITKEIYHRVELLFLSIGVPKITNMIKKNSSDFSATRRKLDELFKR